MLLAVCQAQGIPQDVAPRIATAFGGGMGGSGGTCGALVGAIMAASLRLGRNSAEGERRDAYAAAQRIFDAFEKEMGATVCRQLTGLDLRTREGARQLYESDIYQRVCQRAIPLAARLAEEALAEPRAGPRPAG